MAGIVGEVILAYDAAKLAKKTVPEFLSKDVRQGSEVHGSSDAEIVQLLSQTTAEEFCKTGGYSHEIRAKVIKLAEIFMAGDDFDSRSQQLQNYLNSQYQIKSVK